MHCSILKKRKDFEKMDKIKTIQKEMKNRFKKIVCTGYCELQHLLNYQTPIYYTTRREGWASDIYIFDDIAISTGYAPFGNITVDYDTIQKYEIAAEKIQYNYNLDYQQRKKKVNSLLKKFIKNEVLKNDK